MRNLFIGELAFVILNGIAAFFLARGNSAPARKSLRIVVWAIPLSLLLTGLIMWAYTGKDLLQTGACYFLPNAPQCVALARAEVGPSQAPNPVIPKPSPPASGPPSITQTPSVDEARTEYGPEIFLNAAAYSRGQTYGDQQIYVSESRQAIRIRCLVDHTSSPLFAVYFDVDNNRRYFDRIDAQYHITQDSDGLHLLQYYRQGREVTRYGYSRSVYYKRPSSGSVSYREISSSQSEYIFIIPKRELSLSGTSLSLTIDYLDRQPRYTYSYLWPGANQPAAQYMSTFRQGVRAETNIDSPSSAINPL